MSAVLEDTPLRTLIIELLGEDGMRKLRNRAKANDQLFAEYYTMLSTCRPSQQVYENKRVLKKFHSMVGDSPPTPEMAIEFISRFKDLKATTRSRILYILKGILQVFGSGSHTVENQGAKTTSAICRTCRH